MNNPIVVINGSGKSATLSLTHSFAKHVPHAVHAHQLTQSYGITHIPGDTLANRIKNTTLPVIIVDSYRDIIERKIGSFFQNINTYFSLNNQQILKLYKQQGISPIIQKFLPLLDNLEKYVSADQWKHHFDYDFTQQPFNHQLQYQLYTKDNLTFINLRFKDIASWSNIIKSLDIPIPNLQSFNMLKHNVSNNKWYGKIYKEFKQQITFTREQYNKILSKQQKYMEHFWTSDEIKAFHSKWESKIVN